MLRISSRNRPFLISAVRAVHTSLVVQGNAKPAVSGPNRQVKIMNKLLFGKNKGKKWYDTPSQSTLNQFSSVKSISNPLGVQKHTNRRITVLNKLFMKNITDLMATGAMAESIIGLGIEVSRVRVAPDFQNINVYWLAKGDEDDSAIDSLLRKCSGHLRHELSQLRVMGEVPRIHFVKDLEFAKFVEVERILKGADMGDEEEYSNSTKNIDLGEDNFKDRIPEMRHDVLGLNHSLIFGKIQEKLKVTKVAWDQFKSSPHTSTPQKGETESLDDVWVEARRLQTVERDDRFAEFLKKKRHGKVRNSSSRDDRDFLLEQNSLAGTGEEYQDIDEEVDILEEELFLKNGPEVEDK